MDDSAGTCTATGYPGQHPGPSRQIPRVCRDRGCPSPLAAGLFLARAATRLRSVPNAGPQWEETWVRKWTRATAPSSNRPDGHPWGSLACAFCRGEDRPGTACQCAQTRDLGPRTLPRPPPLESSPLAILLLPLTASDLLWTQDTATQRWALPCTRADPRLPRPALIRETLGKEGWVPMRSNFHWIEHPADGHDRLSLICLRGADWYHPGPQPPPLDQERTAGAFSAQVISRLGLFSPHPPLPTPRNQNHDPNKARRIGEAPPTRAMTRPTCVPFAQTRSTRTRPPSTPGAPTRCTNPASGNGPIAHASWVAPHAEAPSPWGQAKGLAGTPLNTPSKC